MDFWTRLDELLAQNEIIIDRPEGTRHPKYPAIIYPFDYGYLRSTSGGDGNEIDVCRGSLSGNHLVGVICTVDTVKKDAEVKLLVDCTDEEITLIDWFYNANQFMSGIIIRRFGQSPA